MQRKTLFTLLFTIVASAAFAQKGTIKGTVLDSVSAEPLIGTTILIEGTTIGTTADENGGFTISNITPGRVVIIAQYLGYEMFRRELMVEADNVVSLRIPLNAEGINLGDVIVIARIDHESENVLLSGQRRAVAAIQAVGAAEMSRKGIGDARAAVAQVSGISRQEGVKNVFVRGLGDRYNATVLNGFPLPGEDPEYKNIALEFFGSDIIQNIGVGKVFTAANNGDVGGAAIDINSKELIGRGSLTVSVDAGFNGAAAGAGNFMRPDGVNYFGASRTARPTDGRFDFANSLDPKTVRLPLNHSYGIAGGKRWELGEKLNPLSVFVVASHNTDYSFTNAALRKGTADGEITILDQTGKKSTIGIDQLALANVDLTIDRRYSFAYNFLLVHANDQYVADYQGFYPERNQSTENGETFMRRQQSNDNLLTTHQLRTTLNPTERLQVNLGAACNSIKGVEPDRRENNLLKLDDGRYAVMGSDRQRRFFSNLDEHDLNLKASVSWKLEPGLAIEKSNVTLGYRGRRVENNFGAVEYLLGGMPDIFPSIGDLTLDGLYNGANFQAGDFTLDKNKGREGRDNRYEVSKNIHSTYADATHQLTRRLALNVGVTIDVVDLRIDYDTEGNPPGTKRIDKTYYLPSFNLRYDPADSHSLRLGASRSYTLPQSKEISPFQYVNIGFVSEGNPALRPSDNYNVDLKWDWYPSSSELISLGIFYKHITDPIGRVDIGGSAGKLGYNNIARCADIAGVELEVRKNIFNVSSTSGPFRGNRLTVGLNASYIHSDLEFDVMNTPVRKTRLEGASPFMLNGDVSYNHIRGIKALNVSLVVNWRGSQIHTLGTRNYKDIIEEGVTTLSLVTSLKVNNFLTLKLKAGNLLDPTHSLTREYRTRPGKLVLEEYRKGIDVGVGMSFDF
ncbi:MAG: TonB-dependent receptor [Alistipes sp.]|jgi:outer membrane receptor protein involved in Fe transport|nr:TonB-dependent receptor [Alistipes sp.]